MTYQPAEVEILSPKRLQSICEPIQAQLKLCWRQSLISLGVGGCHPMIEECCQRQVVVAEQRQEQHMTSPYCDCERLTLCMSMPSRDLSSSSMGECRKVPRLRLLPLHTDCTGTAPSLAALLYAYTMLDCSQSCMYALQSVWTGNDAEAQLLCPYRLQRPSILSRQSLDLAQPLSSYNDAGSVMAQS